MNSDHGVFIAAGGTGGHIYPALAIAEAFRQLRPDWPIDFVGTPDGLENKIVPPKGFRVQHVRVGRLNQVSKWEKFLTLCRLPLTFFQCWRLLRRHRPRLALGVGGFVSGPILLTAAMMRIPTAIWEPNAMPGLTNRWLARFVDECFLVFDSAKGKLKARRFVASGMPVRAEIESVQPRTEAGGKMRLLIFGGSQGAKALNTVVAELFRSDGEFGTGYEVVHQTGERDYERVKELYGDTLPGLHLELAKYLHDMDQRYRWSDIVVARSGASSVAELAACGKAAILIPLPTAADNHQQKNAEALVKENAAIMILQKDLTPTLLRETLQALQKDPERRRAMERNIRKFHTAHAAERIAGHLLKRIESSERNHA